MPGTLSGSLARREDSSGPRQPVSAAHERQLGSDGRRHVSDALTKAVSGSHFILLALFTYGLWQVIRKQVVTEDGFIYARYVANVLSGNGLVYSKGEYVEAFTSPAWMMLLLGANAAGDFDYHHIVFVAGYLCYAGTFLLLAGMSRSVLTADPIVELHVPVLLLVTCYPVTSFFTTGLETPLVLLHTAWFCRWILKESPGRMESILILGLGPLIRPEQALYSVAGLLYLAVRRQSGTAWVVAGALVPTFAYLVFRIHYYAAFLPITVYMKDAGDLTHWKFGLEYLRHTFDLYNIWIILLFVTVSFEYDLRRGRGRVPHLGRAAVYLLVVATIHVLYIVFQGGDYRHARLLLQPLVVVFVLAGLASGYAGQALKRILAGVTGVRTRHVLVQCGALLFVAFVFLVQSQNEPPAVQRTALFEHGYTDEWKRERFGSFAVANPKLSDWHFDVSSHYGRGGLEFRALAERIGSYKVVSASCAVNFFMGPNVKVLHPLLTDPYVARVQTKRFVVHGHHKSIVDIAPLIAELDIDFYRTAFPRFDEAFSVLSMERQYHTMLPVKNLVLLNFAPDFVERLRSAGVVRESFVDFVEGRSRRLLVQGFDPSSECSMLYLMRRKIGPFVGDELRALMAAKYVKECDGMSDWEGWLVQNRKAIETIRAQVANGGAFLTNVSLAVKALNAEIKGFPTTEYRYFWE